MQGFGPVRQILNKLEAYVRSTMHELFRHELKIIVHEAQDAALFTSWKIDALKCE